MPGTEEQPTCLGVSERQSVGRSQESVRRGGGGESGQSGATGSDLEVRPKDPTHGEGNGILYTSRLLVKVP